MRARLTYFVANGSKLARRWTKLSAFLSGCVLTLALPPVGLWPLVLIVFSSLYHLSAHTLQCGPRAAFGLGWSFGFGFFLSGLYWMGSAFLVEAETYFWLMPFAVTLLPAGLALFYGVAMIFWQQTCCRLWPQNMLAQIFLFIVCLSLAEYARGHIFTGLPWNLIGMVSLGWLPFAQTGAVWGVYGLGVWVLLLGIWPVLWRPYKALAYGLGICFLVLLAQGMLREDVLREGVQRGDKIGETEIGRPIVRIVQPHLEQKEKWQPDLRQAHIQKTIRLTQLDMAPPPDIIIWPETAVPSLLARDAALQADLTQLLPKQTSLIMGSLRREWQAGAARWQSFNSLFVWRAGQIEAVYDKHHLVPFGEYLPFQAQLEALGLRQLTQLRGGFAAGAAPQLITLKKAPSFVPPFVPMICYEVIFPRDSMPANPAQRGDWIVNITNDGWFVQTAGPHQHFAMAQMRAIEEGLPVARAANTGISGMIDPYGRVIQSLPLGVAGVIDVALPPALEATIYARFGDKIFFALLLGLLILPVFIKASKRP
ncbi:MAG: apolipoprotein N-acyltransferase [Parvibaculales bacterium]